MFFESFIPSASRPLEKRKNSDEHEEVPRMTPEEIVRAKHIHEILPALKTGEPEAVQEVSKDGFLLKFLPEKLRADRTVVLSAVKSYPHALGFAAEELRDDSEIIMAAVERWGTMLSLASSRLQDDEDIVLAAVKSHPYALRDASSRLQDDDNIVYEAVKRNGQVMEYASRRIRNDQNFLNRMSQPKEERETREIEDLRTQIQSMTGFKGAQDDPFGGEEEKS